MKPSTGAGHHILSTVLLLPCIEHMLEHLGTHAWYSCRSMSQKVP